MSLFGELKKYLGNSRPPRIVEPDWVDPDKLRKSSRDYKARAEFYDYCNNHYFDILNECWVKEYPSGDCVKSVSFDDFMAGRPDDQGPIEPGYLIPAEEYDPDPEWLEEKKEHWSQWTSMMRDDAP